MDRAHEEAPHPRPHAPDLVPPESSRATHAREAFEIKTEYDVISTLRELGHDVHAARRAVASCAPIREAVDDFKPDIVFNLLEEFHGETVYDHHVVELPRAAASVPYTGCNPRGLMLARDKALSKKLLAYHRIRVPDFAVFPLRPQGAAAAAARLPADREVAASRTRRSASRRRRSSTPTRSSPSACASSTSASAPTRSPSSSSRAASSTSACSATTGSRAFTPWELVVEKQRPQRAADRDRASVKHDPEYQAKKGIVIRAAEELASRRRGAAAARQQAHLPDPRARPATRASTSGSTPRGAPTSSRPIRIPTSREHEEFASAAAFDGIPYPKLLERIVRLGLAPAGVMAGPGIAALDIIRVSARVIPVYGSLSRRILFACCSAADGPSRRPRRPTRALARLPRLPRRRLRPRLLRHRAALASLDAGPARRRRAPAGDAPADRRGRRASTPSTFSASAASPGAGTRRHLPCRPTPPTTRAAASSRA